MEGPRQGIILIDSSIKKQLARSFEIVLFLQRLEQAIGGAEIGNCEWVVSLGFKLDARRGKLGKERKTYYRPMWRCRRR